MEEDVRCKVCLLRFGEGERRPRILPCLHVICHGCLQVVLNMAERAKNAPDDVTVLRCPVCRTTQPLDSSDVDTFPVNRKLLQLATRNHGNQDGGSSDGESDIEEEKLLERFRHVSLTPRGAGAQRPRPSLDDPDQTWPMEAPQIELGGQSGAAGETRARREHPVGAGADPHARHPAPAALRRPDVATPPQRRASDDDDDDVDSFLRNVLRELGGGNGGIGASDQAWGGGVIPVGGGADDLAGVGDVGEGGGDGVAESGGGDGAVGSGEVGDVGGGGSSGRSRVEAAPQNTQLLPSDDVVPDGSSSSDDQIEAQQRLPAGGASAARDPPSRWPDPPPVEPPLPGNQPEAPDWWGLRGDAHNEDCQPIRGERFRALRFPPHMRIERERLLARERGMREVLRAQTRLVDMASGLLCRGRGAAADTGDADDFDAIDDDVNNAADDADATRHDNIATAEDAVDNADDAADDATDDGDATSDAGDDGDGDGSVLAELRRQAARNPVAAALLAEMEAAAQQDLDDGGTTAPPRGRGDLDDELAAVQGHDPAPCDDPDDVIQDLLSASRNNPEAQRVMQEILQRNAESAACAAAESRGDARDALVRDLLGVSGTHPEAQAILEQVMQRSVDDVQPGVDVPGDTVDARDLNALGDPDALDDLIGASEDLPEARRVLQEVMQRGEEEPPASLLHDVITASEPRPGIPEVPERRPEVANCRPEVEERGGADVRDVITDPDELIEEILRGEEGEGGEERGRVVREIATRASASAEQDDTLSLLLVQAQKSPLAAQILHDYLSQGHP